jgi:hypothetical protein
MKKQYIILTLIIFIVSCLSSLDVYSAEKLYVYFDDIGVVVNHEGQAITYDGKPAADHIYWGPLLGHNNFFTPNLMKTGYAEFFSSGKNLTDYEVAIFYMGDQPLQYDGGSGHRVVREIKNMLDAGKRVVLIGNQLLTLAFHEDSPLRDPEVQEFFADYLGVDQDAYFGAINTTQGGQYKPFGIKAIQGDDVSKGYKKACNVRQSENNLEPLHPWRYRPFVEAIDRTEMDSDVVMMEYYTPIYDATELNTAPITDIAMGVHLQRPSTDALQDSKIVFWTSGFEVAAASFYMPGWMEEIWYAVYWCSWDLPKPGPNLQFNVDPLDFGTIPVGDSLELEIKITNMGRDPLEIYDLYLDFPIESGFEVMTDQREYTLDPQESIYIPIMFRPSAEETFDDNLWVESNANNGNMLHIGVIGYGGKKPEPGPKLAVVSDHLDFGTIRPDEKDTMYIVLYNSGIDLLIIQEKFYWPNEKNPPFMYATGYTWPISLDPDDPDKDTAYVPIKFAPAGMQGTFRDTIGIMPYNAINFDEDTLWITLKGISGTGSSDAAISLTDTSLSIDSVELGKKGYTEFTIENTGTQILYIYELQMENDFGGVFKLLDKDDEDFQHELPWALWLGGPQKQRKVKIEFAPTEVKEYTGKALIKLMDEYDNPLPEWDSEVKVTAFGKDSTTSIKDADALDALINMSVYPNPVSESAFIYYTLNLAKPANLKIYIVDIFGNKVLNIKDSQTEPGSYGININTKKLADGMYFIIAQTGVDIVKLPVVLIR